MINRQVLARDLNLLLDSETNSLLRHLAEATPYVSSEMTDLWDDVQKMITANFERAGILSNLLRELNMPEQTSGFNNLVAHFHYVSIQSLLPELLEEKKQQMTLYHRVMEHAAGQQPIAGQLEKLVEQTQHQIETLEGHLSAV